MTTTKYVIIVCGCVNRKGEKMEKIETLWSWLVDAGIITDDLQLMTDIDGFSIVWLDEVLYTYKNK